MSETKNETPEEIARQIEDILGEVGDSVDCAICGRRKCPRGRDTRDNGLCNHDCPGYSEPPHPDDLWPGELRVQHPYCGRHHELIRAALSRAAAEERERIGLLVRSDATFLEEFCVGFRGAVELRKRAARILSALAPADPAPGEEPRRG